MIGNRSNTAIACGTVILLASIGAVLYLSNSNAPSYAAMGIIGTIVASVLAGTFGLVKLGSIEAKVDTAVEQTNGGLTKRMEKVARDANADLLDTLVREYGLTKRTES